MSDADVMLLGVFLVLLVIGAGVGFIVATRQRVEQLRAGGTFPPVTADSIRAGEVTADKIRAGEVRLPPGYDGWYDEAGPMPPPIHWRLSDHEPPPVVVHIEVDTSEFERAMREAGEALRPCLVHAPMPTPYLCELKYGHHGAHAILDGHGEVLEAWSYGDTSRPEEGYPEAADFVTPIGESERSVSRYCHRELPDEWPGIVGHHSHRCDLELGHSGPCGRRTR